MKYEFNLKHPKYISDDHFVAHLSIIVYREGKREMQTWSRFISRLHFACMFCAQIENRVLIILVSNEETKLW